MQAIALTTTTLTAAQATTAQANAANATDTTTLRSVPGKDRVKPRLVAEFARSPKALRRAQRLRAKVFGEEYGVVFSDPDGLDRDSLDDYCEHLNVYDVANDNKLIATTRLLSSEKARLAGGYYSAHEFDMSAIERLPGRVLELGRTCVHKDYRSGAAITVLWSALADYLMAQGFSYLVGCASISLRDGGHNLAAIMPELRAKHFVGNELRVRPLRGLAIEAPQGEADATLPPLLKAYLRMGCKIGGEACWDPEFNCADVFVMLDVAALSARYAQRFLKAG
jgi:putative hemolysin